MQTNTYIVTVQHDHGILKIQTTASSKQEAKRKIMEYEGCPESAIKAVSLITIRSSANTPSEYELARRIGDSRFGTSCRHERTSHGRCLNCQRKVV